MGAVFRKVFAPPDEVVRLAALQAVGPQVRPPEQKWHLHFAFGRIIVQRRLAGDLILDQPAHAEGAFKGVRFGVETRAGVSCVDPTGQICQAQVWVTLLEFVQHDDQVSLQRLGVFGERTQRLRPGPRLFDPHDLHLLGRNSGSLQAPVLHVPG